MSDRLFILALPTYAFVRQQFRPVLEPADFQRARWIRNEYDVRGRAHGETIYALPDGIAALDRVEHQPLDIMIRARRIELVEATPAYLAQILRDRR